MIQPSTPSPVNGDSSRYFNEVWTDARHIPVFPATTGVLGDLDRPGQNFGLISTILMLAGGALVADLSDLRGKKALLLRS